jgi:aryl-alcohol dehydrogenase-like predicted oxidoreductase
MGKTQYGQIDDNEATKAVRYALDHGITLFDTAEAYGPGHSETLLGRALGSRRKDIILVTKVGLLFDENQKIFGLDAGRNHILAATEGCLKRLGTDWIDLLLIHWPDHKTPAAETIGALEELKKEGKIREYGVSNYSVNMMEECQQCGHIAVNQVGYHMFDRRMEAEIFPYCAEKKIGFMAYGTLAFGLLTGAFTPETTFVDWDWRSKGKAFGIPLFEREHFSRELKVVDALKNLAKRYDKTVAQLAIAWVLNQKVVSTALVGARNPSEISENIEAAGWVLADEIKTEIDRIFAKENVPTYRDGEQILIPPALQKT